MFKWNRILVALIGVPLLFFVYTNKTFRGIPLLIFTLFIVGVGLYEFYDMLKKSGKEVYDKFGIFIGLLIPLINYFRIGFPRAIETSVFYETPTFFYKLQLFFVENEIIYLALILLLVYRVLKNQIKGTLEKVGYTIFGIIYVSVFFSEIINIYSTDFYLPDYHINLLLLTQILVWVSDTSAGIVGVSIGRKFFKNGFTEISPKKSVEGAIGSIVFTALISGIISYFINLSYPKININYLYFIILGIVVAILAQIGDLIESLIKRECGVKDSGTILMGHGGILDRFDSMLLVLPFISYVLSYFL